MYEKDTERRAVSTEMIANLANKSGIKFVDEIAATKPFDLIFITSDIEDDCFKVLQTIESKKLTKPGTGKFSNFLKIIFSNNLFKSKSF